MALLAAFVGLVFAYSLVSRRLERTVVTAPILFTFAGMLAALATSVERNLHESRGAFLLIAEMGLVLTLFTDAARTNLRVLGSIRALPVRLLSTGMLLTILLGMVVALLLFPGLSVWEAGILSAILAPTDAGLGQVIVNSPRVPQRIRQALNVEAGLNDGLSVPFMMFFIALALSGTDGAGAVLMKFVVEQLGYGAAIGIAFGLAGGWLLGRALAREWMTSHLGGLGLVAIPVLCVLASKPVGASVFIAAFVAGLVVQVGFREAGRHSIQFTEDWGQILDFFVFFLFGLLAVRDLPTVTLPIVLYAVASLTVVRMLPVALALIGTRLSRATVLFMGWFGPRGLASIVLGLVYLEQEAKLPGESTIRLAVIVTVLLSIFAHGLSALPGINLYTRKLAALDPAVPERQEVSGG